MLQVLGTATEFERTLIVERTRADQARYRETYEKGRIGKSVHSRWGANFPSQGTLPSEPRLRQIATKDGPLGSAPSQERPWHVPIAASGYA